MVANMSQKGEIEQSVQLNKFRKIIIIIIHGKRRKNVELTDKCHLTL